MTNNSNRCSMLFFVIRNFNIALCGTCLFFCLASKSIDVHHLRRCVILIRQFTNALDLNAYFMNTGLKINLSIGIFSPRLLSGRWRHRRRSHWWGQRDLKKCERKFARDPRRRCKIPSRPSASSKALRNRSKSYYYLFIRFQCPLQHYFIDFLQLELHFPHLWGENFLIRLFSFILA